MSLSPKKYQSRCLKVLADYLSAASSIGAASAFKSATGRGYRSVRQLPGVPYVCLRVPTGGGKTFLAAYACPIATSEFLRTERGVVLWLAPTTAIVDQTLTALRNVRHPYREALNEGFRGLVEVLSIGEALQASRSLFDSSNVIIVATLASLRVEQTEGRRVYEPNGALQNHFVGLADAQLARLERSSAGSVLYSLANALRLRRPIVIVDEAHNARTPLSFDTLARLEPSCILEFTATPDQETAPSNVLYAVSAAELKAEKMIKLPIRLASQSILRLYRQAVLEACGEQVKLQRRGQGFRNR